MRFDCYQYYFVSVALHLIKAGQVKMKMTVDDEDSDFELFADELNSE